MWHNFQPTDILLLEIRSGSMAGQTTVLNLIQFNSVRNKAKCQPTSCDPLTLSEKCNGNVRFDLILRLDSKMIRHVSLVVKTLCKSTKEMSLICLNPMASFHSDFSSCYKRPSVSAANTGRFLNPTA